MRLRAAGPIMIAMVKLLALLALVSCVSAEDSIEVSGRDFVGDGVVDGAERRGFSSLRSTIDTGSCSAKAVELDADAPGGADGVDLFVVAGDKVVLDIEGSTTARTIETSFAGRAEIHVLQRDLAALAVLRAVRISLDCD